MVNITSLKDIIRKKGLSIKELSKSLEIDPSTFYRKMQSCGDSFTVKEATEISLQLNLTAEQVQNIFFCQFNRINAIRTKRGDTNEADT